jgi:hypothetical protein
MKTKSLLIILFFALLFFSSCENRDNPTLVVTPNESGLLPATETSFSFRLISNLEWTATPSSEGSSWCKVEPSVGIGDGSPVALTVIVAANNSVKERMTSITIASGSMKRNVTVTQAGRAVSAPAALEN